MREIIGAGDEPFLQRMMLVFMDLVSGYVLLEEVADDRTYETWYDRVKERLEPLKTRVLYLVSDRAKALIKLAETGLEVGCHGPTACRNVRTRPLWLILATT